MSELRPGKRTLIERSGHEFEPPEEHEITLMAGRRGEETYVLLDTRYSSSLYLVREIEEREDAVVVHLGDEMARSGPAGFGGVVPEPIGYQFPDESSEPPSS